MATTAMLDQAAHGHLDTMTASQSAARLVVCVSLPLGAFGLIHLAAGAFGMFPNFFAPFGLPHWGGAALHLVQLALLGAAFWALTEQVVRGTARQWLIGLTILYSLLPFFTPLLDSLQLGLVCTAMFLSTLAAIQRVGSAAPLAGWLMAPMLALTGTGAALGLTIAAAYSPPFALMQSGHTQPAA
ncbi:MAG: hypothetical protein RLW68_13395 [Devosia marina]|uniref:hypothetical protein n=1 Tax=Devosia marina TaxID=2683198 RepID=UPI000D5F6BF0